MELLEKMRDYVGSAGYRDDNGNPITGESYDPILVLAAMSVDNRLKPDIRLAAAREAARYIHPQMSNLQVSGNPEKPLLIHHEHQVVDARTMKPVDPEQIKQLQEAGVETIDIKIKSFSRD
jgi:hypothetical protein